VPGLTAKGRTSYRGPECPDCGTLVPEAPERGRVTCAACQQTFELALLHPPERTGPRAEAIAPGSAPCARHAHNLAVTSCEHCGAFMCALCRVDVEGSALCAACFERLGAKGTLPSTRTGYRHYNGIAVMLAFAGLFPFTAVVFGPLAVLAAWKGLRQGHQLGETLGATGAKLSLALGVVEALGGVLTWYAAFAGMNK
jgi:hypothetical protein